MHARSLERAESGLAEAEQREVIELLKRLGHGAAETPLPAPDEKD